MAHFIHNNQQHNLYRAGNGENGAFFWGIIGSLMATFSPLLFWTRNDEVTVSAGTLSVTTNSILILAASTYIAVYFLRKTPAMRVRRGWVGAATLNCVASIIVTVVTVKCEPKVENVYGLMFVAVAVLALGEVAKPIFGFGLVVQAFLRMPLQKALFCRFVLKNGEVGPVTICVATLLLLVGTLWQSYFAVGE